MNRSLITPDWTNDPSFTMREVITLADVLGVAGHTIPGNSVNSIQLTLGNVTTGETYVNNALLYSPPGLLSMPLGPGSYDSSGTFTPSNTSIAGCQSIAYFKDDSWIVFGTRDTRNQYIAGSLNPGETCLYSQAGGGKILLTKDGAVTASSSTSNSSNPLSIAITPSNDTINLTNSLGYGININSSGITLTVGSNSITLDSSGNFSVSTVTGVSFSSANISSNATSTIENNATNIKDTALTIEEITPSILFGATGSPSAVAIIGPSGPTASTVMKSLG